jgi:23S rRNA (uracil1939-C5)-methyltransferase
VSKKKNQAATWLGRTVQVTVDALDDHGQGVGSCQDRRVAIWGALPGDTVEATVTWASPVSPWTRATLERRMTHSPQRMPAGCAHAPRCAGCPLVDLAPQSQLHHKHLRVERALAQAGVVATVEPVVPAPLQLGYRARAKFVVHRGDDGVVLGAYGPDSHDVWPSAQCVVVHPSIHNAIQALLPLLQAHPATLPRYVVCRTNGEHTLGCLVMREAHLPETLVLAKAWRAATPALCGVTEHHQPDQGDAIFSTMPGATTLLDGVDTLAVVLGGVEVLLAPLAGRHILDAYCGLGAFAFLLRGAAAVHGVDNNPEAIAAAQQAAHRAGLAHVTFETGDAAAVLAQHTSIDAVVVDPPRKGIPVHARDALAAHGPPTLIYVACEPAALARDAGPLLAAGYQLRSVRPFDLFPGTPEVEVVAHFTRGNQRSG